MTGADRPNGNGEARARVRARLVEEFGPKLVDDSVGDNVLQDVIRRRLGELLDEEEAPLSRRDKATIIQEVTDDVLGLGPLDAFLRDPEVTQIMVNNAETIYVERGEKVYWTGAKFFNEEQLRRTIDKIISRVGRRLDESSPYVEARMPDGSWVNAIIPPLALDGAVLTIRKFSQDLYTADDLVSLGTMSSTVVQFLDACVQGRINVIVSGATETGRTTNANAMASFIPDAERIITIEEAAELRLQQPHVVRLQAKPADAEGKGEISVRDLVRQALRMRPARVVLGELRAGEALEMLRAIHTGLDGWITTVYGGSPRDALARLETMVRMAGMDLTQRGVRHQVASGIQLIVHQARMKDGSRRVTHVTEVLGMEGDTIRMEDIFLLDFKGYDKQGRFQGELKPTGARPRFLDTLRDRAIYLPPALLMQSDRGLGW
ncbi:MAG: CpaF family protein [Actinomycetota bacterium]|nr:CpaF family protein [Actinomycetota bacterium]